jgi:hypothetical protein
MLILFNLNQKLPHDQIYLEDDPEGGLSMGPGEELNAIAIIAERRIAEAMAEGQFDNLPGQGRPQQLEDLSHLAPEMRLAYIVLKNSGFLEAGPERRPAAAKDCGRPEGDWAKVERLRFRLARAGRIPGRRTSDCDPLERLDPVYLDKLLQRL